MHFKEFLKILCPNHPISFKRNQICVLASPQRKKNIEKRIALTPEGAKELGVGHVVQIESGAGVGAGFSDELYRSAGCIIASSLKQVWDESELIVS